MHFFSVRLKFCLVFHCSLPFGLTDDPKARSPAAYPHLPSAPLNDLSYDVTIILNQRLSRLSLHPKNLGVIPDGSLATGLGERLRRVVLRS